MATFEIDYVILTKGFAYVSEGFAEVDAPNAPAAEVKTILWAIENDPKYAAGYRIEVTHAR